MQKEQPHHQGPHLSIQNGSVGKTLAIPDSQNVNK